MNLATGSRQFRPPLAQKSKETPSHKGFEVSRRRINHHWSPNGRGQAPSSFDLESALADDAERRRGRLKPDPTTNLPPSPQQPLHP